MYNTGDEVQVKEAKLYPNYSSKSSSEVITGTYWIYSNIEKNNRIRITDRKEKVNQPCQMTGWIDINYIVKDNVEED